MVCKMQIIDAHVHIGLSEHREKITEQLSFDLCNDYNDFLKCMDNAQIERSVILPIPHRDFNAKISNEYLLEASVKSSNRLIPFCRIDKDLEENLKNGFYGAKLHLVYEDHDIKKLKKEFKILEYYNIPLLIHAKFKDKVKQIEDILKYAPNLNIILAHMGRGHINTDEGIVENAQSLKKYDNVFFETSTVKDITPETSNINKVCQIIGKDRILFGSDYPFEKDKCKYRDIIDNFLNFIQDKNSLNSIMYSNIYNLLNLGGNMRVVIRSVKKSDIEQLNSFFQVLSEEDKKFLALAQKLSYIKTVIKAEKHCYVALKQNTIVGFLRESGRPEGFSLLEELVVHPDYRRKGIAKKLLTHYHNIFLKTLAKTNAKNNGMISMLKNNDYTAENPNALRIINWSRNVSDV